MRTVCLFVGPLPPGELDVTDFGSTTITVSWGPALDQLAVGYSLTAMPVSGQGQTMFANFGRDTTVHTFTGLVPGTNYQITLQINGVVSSPSSITQYTRKS